jgi:hypothetical protein
LSGPARSFPVYIPKLSNSTCGDAQAGINQKLSALTTSPEFRVPIAHHVRMVMEPRIKRTSPSQKRAFAPRKSLIMTSIYSRIFLRLPCHGDEGDIGEDFTFEAFGGSGDSNQVLHAAADWSHQPTARL